MPLCRKLVGCDGDKTYRPCSRRQVVLFSRDVADVTAVPAAARPGAGDDTVPGLQRMLPLLRRHRLPRGDHQHAPAAGAHEPLAFSVSHMQINSSKIRGLNPQILSHNVKTNAISRQK